MDPDSNRRGAGLRVLVTDGRGQALRDGGLARWLARVAPRTATGEVGIALVADARMRVLNRSYRRKDYATDVLSFPAGLSSHELASERAALPLGDLVIATGVAARQARDAGHSVQTELRILALHGLLHLLGYDHDDPADQGRMARAEARLLRKGGVKHGLIQRAAGARPRAARARAPRIRP